MGLLEGIMRVLGSIINGYDNNVSSKRGSVNQGEMILCQRLEEVFKTEYPDCEFRTNISASEIEITTIATDYSYGLYRNGTPIAFINVIKNRNDYRRLKYREAKAIAIRHGIPHMNFFTHLPNEVEYISQRLKNEIFG